MTGACEKIPYVIDHFAPRTDLASRRGESFQQPTSVRFRHDSWVGDDDDATIGSAANESAESLLQSQRRVRQHVIDERIAAVRSDRFAVSGGHGLGRHAEGKLGDQQRTQRVTGHVDTFPERGRAEEHRAPGRTKAGEERVASVLAVHEQRPAPLRTPRAQLGGHRAYVAVACEEHEHSAVRRGGEIQCEPCRRELMRPAVDVRRRHVGRDREERLLAVSKGRREESGARLDLRLGEPEAACEKSKVGGRGAAGVS